MKKTLLILSLLACVFCLFAVSVSAQEVTDTFYVVASQDSDTAIALKNEGKNTIVLSEVYASTTALASEDWMAQFNDGDHVELIFAENIVESVGDNTGILLQRAVTVTVRYGEFFHLVTNSARSNVFVLRHSGAKINLLGGLEIYGSDGEVNKDFTYNSSDLTKNNVQIRHGKVYCWVYDGSVYAENMRTQTGEEFVYTETDDSGSDGAVTNTYEFVNCAMNSNTTALGLDGRADAMKIIIIRGGYCSKLLAYTVCNGTLFENCTIDTFVMDCWSITNQMAVFKNCSLGKINTSTGRTHLTFIDCTFDLSSLSLGSDGAGKCYALVYTSATCENDGVLNVYANGSGTTPVNSKDVNNDSTYAQTVTDFYADPQNYALGHNVDWTYNYAGDKFVSKLTAVNGCSRCASAVETVSIDALFTTLGYSVPTFGGSISIRVGFAINKDAIAQYEALSGTKISFGCVVASKDRLGEFNAPLDENGNEVVLSQGQVIKADITDNCYDQMSLMVSLSEEFMDSYLLMSGFIIESADEAIEISYLQDNSSLVSDNKFEYVSYNTLLQ